MIQVLDSLGQLKVTGAGGGGGGNTGSISAGTTKGTLGEVVFSNSNGVSFGMNGQTMTASHNGLTSQSNQAFSAQGGSSAFQTLAFNNANGATFSNNAGAVELSYTVPSTAGLLSNIRVSAGTTSNLLSAITFNNGGGVSFGLDASTITATVATSLTNIRVSAGTTSNLLSAITFNNANGITFGLDASTLTASYTVPTVTNSSWTVSDAVTSATVGRLAFTNSNGLTLSLSTSNNGNHTVIGSYTVPTVTNSSWTVSDAVTSQTIGRLAFTNANGLTMTLSTSNNGNATVFGSYTVPTLTSWTVSDAATSQTIGRLAFTNSNGLTLSLSTSNNGNATVIGSYTVPTQSNQDITLYATGNTTQNSSTVINANSLLFGGRGNVSIGFSNGSIQISDTGAAGGGITNINLSAGTTSNNASNFTFADSNQISFGLNAGTITASFNPINIGMSTNGNTAGTTGTFDGAGLQYVFAGGTNVTLSQSSNASSVTLSINGVSFANSNGVTFGHNAGTITASVPLNATITQRFGWPPGNFTAVAAMGNGSYSINRLQLYQDISMTRLEVPFLVSIASSATANTWGLAVTAFGAIYTKNVSTLSSLSSGSQSFSFTLASNSAGQTQVIAHAIRPISIPMNVVATPGEYYVGFGISTNTSSVGTATTALGITWSVMGGPVYSSAVGQVAEFTATTNTSTGLWGGQGVYSAAISTVPPTVSLSAINQTGSYYARGNMGIIFRNI